MKNSAALCGVLALALCACSEMHAKDVDRGAPSTGSTPAGRKIVVYVSITGTRINPIPDVNTDPQHIEIHWIINTPNYAFPRDGIVIDPTDWDCAQDQAGRTEFVCVKNKHYNHRYKYIVNVDNVANPQHPVPLPGLDPWINNQ
jgi:hypothetical protein